MNKIGRLLGIFVATAAFLLVTKSSIFAATLQLIDFKNVCLELVNSNRFVIIRLRNEPSKPLKMMVNCT